MIVAKTRMRKIPKTCKDCALGKREFGADRVCSITGKDCPMELYRGNWKYGKPTWCPLEESHDLLSRADAAEAAQETLQRAMAEYKARAEKAERERDAAVSDLTFAVNEYRRVTTDIDLCGLCEFDLPPAGENGQTAECPGFYEDNCFKWRGQKEE